MERMLQMMLTGILLMALFVQTNEGKKLYYITPNLHSNLNCSHNQSCLTFQQFINSSHPSSQSHTLMFLTGYHKLTKIGEPYSVYYKYFTMVGISAEVIIHDTNAAFYRPQMLQLMNLILSNGRFRIEETTRLYISSVTLINFVLYTKDTVLAQLTDCEFSSGVSPLILRNSNVTLSGNSKFLNNYNSALVSYSTNITLSGTVSFVNNTGIRGGAMALYSSTIYLMSGLIVTFMNNSAQETGGAIHIEPDMTRNFCPECFYEVSIHHTGITFYYSANFAEFGGDNIYGTSLTMCEYFTLVHNVSDYFLSNDSMTSVSSDPTQVCLCDNDGRPQCKNVSHILTNKNVHPGERFTLPAVIVGGDYGTTIGIVHASFMPTYSSSVPALETSQYSQWIDTIAACTDLQYTVYSNHIGQIFTIYLSVHFSKHLEIISQNDASCDVTKHRYDSSTPTYINLTILPCPVGFNLFENPSRCNCHSILNYHGVKCRIINGTGWFSWNSTLWISITDTSFTYAKYCPLHYCDPEGKEIELTNNPSVQCAFDRAGRLCGGCKENYSLAIGSSHCIHCPNNNGLTLIIFFAAAGLLLVLSINILDITLTQGLIDGLVFYANIVWTYQSVLFPEEQYTNPLLIFLKTFIAWINLDFGIEICFVRGLTAHWKTWLQFIFPFYIWAIVGLMIFTARHSRILTKLYGNRAVPVLATLFLLSYMKLLRTVTSIYMLSHIVQYPEKSTVTVWSVDGNIDYFGLPHLFLLVAALIVQIFLWLPYTFTLLLHQLLQKVSRFKIFRWVTNLKPVFDVHFAPFKPAHRYWFGVLLLARGILLIIFSSSYATPNNTNLLLLLITILILLLYMAIVQPYKNKIILIIQSSLLANIIFLSVFVLYTQTQDNKNTLQTIFAGISVGVAFLQFCGLIICNIIRLCCRRKCKSQRYNRINFEDELELDENFSTNYRGYIMNALF